MSRARRTIVFWVVAALFVAACFLIATATDAWLVPAPRFGTERLPLVVESERLLDCLPPSGRSIAALPDGVRLYANTDLAFRAATIGADDGPLYIVARGRPLDGVWPLLTVRVDRELRGALFVTSRDWGLYRIDIAMPAGLHHFRISYANDRSHFPDGRDLDISGVALGGPPPGWDDYMRWRSESLLPASMFSIQTFAEPEGAAVRLWKDGSLADDIFYSAGGMQEVTILAASAGGGQGRLALLVDGEEMERFEIAEQPSGRYRALFELPAGLHRLALLNLGGDILVRYLIADGAVPPASSTAAPLALGAGLTIPARMFNGEAAGRLQQDGSRLLWSNGYIGRSITNGRARKIRLTLIARGELCEEQGPRLLLMVGDDQLALIDVNEVEFHPYAVDLDLAPGEHMVRVVYTNDRFVPGLCDRNLYLLEARLEELP